jgi:glutathione synthase/RimK-type ligase-like ATP-grasp enzyme
MKKKRVLLVIGGKPEYDWKAVFQGATLHNGLVQVEVEWASWDDIRLTSYSDSGAVVDIINSSPEMSGTNASARVRTIQPDFLLIRGAAQGVYGQDYRNLLVGFMHAGLPSINSLESLYLCQEKPIIYGKLRKLQKQLGHDAFPLIDQTYYPNWRTMTFSTGFPLVVKLGTAHAGFGKMKLNNQEQFADFQSVVALQGRYVTAEPFIDWDYDFRIQKIGDHYRAFRRFSTNWKGKGLQQHDEDVPLSPRLKAIVEHAAQALGMDICAVDGVHSKTDDKEYIIELNDSAIGLNSRYNEEDLKHICELVLLRMSQAFPLPDGVDESGTPTVSPSTATTDEPLSPAAKEKIAQISIQRDRAVAEKEALAAELQKLNKEKSSKTGTGKLTSLVKRKDKKDKHQE